MATLSCTPAGDLSSSLFPLGHALSSSSTWFLRLHDTERIFGKRRNSSSSVRCCEKKPSSVPRKRLRIPSKRIKTDRPWWNVIFKAEDAPGMRSSAGTEFNRSKGRSNSDRDTGSAKRLVAPVLESDTSSSNAEEKGVKVMRTRDNFEGGFIKRPVKTPQAPLLEALKNCAAQDMAAFHYPGPHREFSGTNPLVDGVGSALFSQDQQKVSQINSLFTPSSVIAAAQNNAALAFGADSTFFLINGTTCGIQAAIMAQCKPGDFLILPRNCHSSAMSGMVLSGSKPWYMIPEYDANWGTSQGVRQESVAAAIAGVKAAGGSVGAVLVVSPTKFGICSPIRQIAKLCQSEEVPLIVDEAHGAHFRFHVELPESALEQGADLTVQSTHKVLGSLTQSAMLHLRSEARVDRLLLIKCLQIVQSSNPSYLLLSSLDVARAQFTAPMDGPDGLFSSSLLEAAMDFAFVTKERLREIPNIVVLDEKTVQYEGDIVPQLDPLRITVGLWELDLDGYAADDVLRKKFGIIAEFPSFQSITFGINIGTTARDVARLVEAWRTLSMWFSKNSNYITMEGTKTSLRGDRGIIKHFLDLPCSPAMSPRDVFFCETVPMETENVLGQISAEILCPHPPVIPVITPGDIISEQALEFLRNTLERGGLISGASDACLRRITVCKR